MTSTNTIIGRVKREKIDISKYRKLEHSKDKKSLSDIFYNRLYDRYLKPFTYNAEDFRKEYKNGFSIMANCCLLIETYMSFKEKHLIDTNGKSNECFRLFFTQSTFFEIFAKGGVDENGKLKSKKQGGRPNEFYSNVRCGILHIGETKNGWKIRRDLKTPLFDEATKTINATKFANALEKEIKSYTSKLKKSDWSSNEWVNFRLKMDDIIKNCNY
jgi:hypothetical protein